MAIDPGFISSLIHPLPPLGQGYLSPAADRLTRWNIAKMQQEGADERQKRQLAARQQESMRDEVWRWTQPFLESQKDVRKQTQEAVDEYNKALVSANPDAIKAAQDKLQAIPGVQITTEDPRGQRSPDVGMPVDPGMVARAPGAPTATREPIKPKAPVRPPGITDAHWEAIQPGLEEETPAVPGIEGSGGPDMGGAEAAPEAPAEPAAPIWQSRHFIQLPDGSVIENDPNEAGRLRQQLTQAILSPLEQNADTPEKRRAAKLAMAAGAKAASTIPYGKAVERGYDTYWKALGQEEETKRARIMASKGAGGAELGKIEMLQDAQDDALQEAQEVYDLRSIIQETDAARGAYEKITNSSNPVIQRDAIREYLAATESRPSDKDYERVEVLSGKIEQLRNKARELFESGTLTEEYRSNFAELQELVERRALERRRVVAKSASDHLLSSYTAERLLSPGQRRALAAKVYRQVAGLPASGEEVGGAAPGFGARESERTEVEIEGDVDEEALNQALEAAKKLKGAP